MCLMWGTAITFEYAMPPWRNFAEESRTRCSIILIWWRRMRLGILGYAYAGRFQTRAAYDWAVETSIYIRMDQKRRGLGRILYALEEGLKRTGG